MQLLREETTVDQTARKKTVHCVYAALLERGYRPVNQLTGYILTGDPTYITNHKGARQMIANIDRYELLRDLLNGYFAGETGDRP